MEDRVLSLVTSILTRMPTKGGLARRTAPSQENLDAIRQVYADEEAWFEKNVPNALQVRHAHRTLHLIWRPDEGLMLGQPGDKPVPAKRATALALAKHMSLLKELKKVAIIHEGDIDSQTLGAYADATAKDSNLPPLSSSLKKEKPPMVLPVAPPGMVITDEDMEELRAEQEADEPEDGPEQGLLVDEEKDEDLPPSSVDTEILGRSGMSLAGMKKSRKAPPDEKTVERVRKLAKKMVKEQATRATAKGAKATGGSEQVVSLDGARKARRGARKTGE